VAAVWAGKALHDAARTPVAPGPPPFRIPKLTPAPDSAVPATAPVPADPGAWLAHVASTTDVPARALRAYTEAAVKTRAADPGCHLDWATLAGIGRTESDHGSHGDSHLGADGEVSPPVIGPTLDGSPGLRAVADTDGGRLDGDPVWDHAVGPMQFLPKTWAKWGVRAAGDGAAPDPENMDDAALTAARYLCAQDGDLATPNGWWTAVLTYNNSVSYGQEVFSNADAYARASLKP
jgi:membrane-bound lytic murein transglycosylase B